MKQLEMQEEYIKRKNRYKLLFFSSIDGLFYTITANGWVFLLAGIVITGLCKYNK